MALILNIETSSPVCSVCLSKDGEVIALKEDRETNHASMLTVFIRELFEENNFNIHAIDAVAVSAGPGSYTGLRIGAATVKGICFSLSKPLIAVDSLLALAQGMISNQPNREQLYCPTIDARRNEIYYALIDVDGVVIHPSVNAQLSSSPLFKIQNKQRVLVGGSGAAKSLQYWKEDSFQADQITLHSSKWMIPLSEKKFSEQIFEAIADFEPSYIKPVFIRNTEEKQLK